MRSSKTPTLCSTAGKRNAGDLALTLPFTKEDVDTRVKTVAAALKAVKDARKAALEATKSAKRTAAAALATGTGAASNEGSKRRRTKSAPTACAAGVCARALQFVAHLYRVEIIHPHQGDRLHNSFICLLDENLSPAPIRVIA